MKKLLLSGTLLFALIFTGLSQVTGVFHHPGIFSSQAELDSLKSFVQAGSSHPQVAGYNNLAGKSWGLLNYSPTPFANVHVVASGIGDEERAFRQDAHAMYIHAIKWVVTGDSAHRDKAMEIADAWSTVFKTLVTEPNKPKQPTLEASWAVPIWVVGAEILKYYNDGESGWSSTSFESFLDKLKTYVNGPIFNTPNWQLSKYLSLMSMGVFLEDAAMYNSGFNGAAGQIDDISATGVIPELTRDFEHSQYVMIGMTQCAEIAFQQGDSSLFTRSDHRLLVGAEAYTRCVMGLVEPNYLSASKKKRKSAPYEILLNRYTKLGLPVPNVQTYVLTMNRTEDGIEEHFVGWLSATHAIEVEVTSNMAIHKPIKAVNIYPNPATDAFHITSNTFINSVTIFNCTGSVILKKQELNSLKTYFDISSIDRGIYLYQIVDEDGYLETGKLLVE